MRARRPEVAAAGPQGDLPQLEVSLHLSSREVVAVYQYAPGRHADYTPGSPDLDHLVQLMNALHTIKVPDDHGPYKRAEDRWKPYLDDPESAAVFAGPVLTHSDWTPGNVLISGHRAWLIDWAWPTLGAGWTDPACWVLGAAAHGIWRAHRTRSRTAGIPPSHS
jgi:hypothetical protein